MSAFDGLFDRTVKNSTSDLLRTGKYRFLHSIEYRPLTMLQTISDLLLYAHNQRPLLEYAASRCLHPCLGPLQDQLARLGSEIRSLSFSDIPNIVRKVCADDVSEYRTFLQHLWRVINSDLLDQYNPRLLHRLPVYWASLDSDYPAITPES